MSKSIKSFLLIGLILMNFTGLVAQENDSLVKKAHKIIDIQSNKRKLVYKFDIKQEIAPAIWRQTQQSIDESVRLKADLIIIHMNTYGGMLESADSIRTKILNCPIPVYVFIDNNAASAGALISIACDSIYMRKGANIGAATVVDQTGKPMPDKYQSYMRSMMRSTAEAHGKVKEIKGTDTVERWFRDPQLASAMVGAHTKIEGVIDTGKVLTFTTADAIKMHYCEGEAENIREVLKKAGISDYEVKEYKLTSLERFIGFFLSPIVQGILIMLIVAGIYFEFQSPGLVFPIAISAVAALFYFAPLYLDGLAANWEIVIFVIGVILLGIEIFVIPGFGFMGASGIVLMVLGLTLAMINNLGFEINTISFGAILRSLFMVVALMMLSLILSIFLTRKLLSTRAFSGLALETVQNVDEGYIGVENYDYLTGKTGIAATILRPAGKVRIDDEMFDAKAIRGYIDEGDKVVVVKYETGQLYVEKC